MRSETAITNTPNSNVMSGSKPTFLSKGKMQFLIMDAPRSTNLFHYIKECKRHNVTDIVRVCEPTYPKTELTKAGISLHEMPYPDGHSPPDEVLDRWLTLVDERFIHPVNPLTPAVAGAPNNINGSSHHSEIRPNLSGPTIAVHCVAGLGRAPVLVAIALIEFAKMEPVDAAQFIRKHRRGAINNTQLDWLNQYRRRYRRSKAGGSGDACCVVM